MKLIPASRARVLSLLVALTTLSLAFALLPLSPRPGSGPVVAAATPVPTKVVIEVSDPPRTATPTGKQELRLAGTILDPAPLDPAFARDVNSAFMARQVFRGLTRFGPALEPVPELAERIVISGDGLTYRFTLRDTARFADGSPITADDVVFSLTRALSPATAEEGQAALAGPSYLADIAGATDVIRGAAETLTGVRALDERNVEITLAAPRATFLMKLASAPASVVDRNDVARGGEWWRNPNASGPFRVDYWEPAEELRLTGNPNFVRGEPALKSVVFRIGPSAANPFNLYQADEIDVAPVPINAVDRIADEAGPLRGELTVSPILATEYIAFRTDVPPMDDPEIRRAIQHAFPRGKISEILLSDRQQIAKGIIPPGTLARDWPASAPDHDLDEARAAIARSRYGSADKVPPIRVYGSGPFGAEVLRDVLQDDLGLTVEILDVHWPQFNAGLANRSFPAFELQWVGDFPDPETFLWALFDSDSPDNYSDYHNPEFDALLDEAAATLDVEERAKIYAEAEAVLLADNVFLPVAHDVRYTVMKPWVRNLAVTPLGMLYLEDVWLER